MNFKDYSVYYNGGESYKYCEENQMSSLRWVPLAIDHDKKEINANDYPFVCREFLSDYIFWANANATGEMYGWSKESYPEVNLDYTSHLALCVTNYDEVAVLRELCDAELDLDLPALRDPDTWSDDEEEEVEWVGIIEVPEYARKSPLGMLLWTLGIRGHVENRKITPDAYGFGIPEALRPGNNMSIIAELDTKLVSKLYKFRKNYLWEIDDAEYSIGMQTHEYFSPCTLLEIFTNSKAAIARQIAYLHQEEDDWGDPMHNYQARQVELAYDCLKK
jgi:hypothetical protein